jgi:hypothetical protein
MEGRLQDMQVTGGCMVNGGLRVYKRSLEWLASVNGGCEMQEVGGDHQPSE